MQESNWFSAPSALRVYGQYLNLDKDRNGMLSKEELARWGLMLFYHVLWYNIIICCPKCHDILYTDMIGSNAIILRSFCELIFAWKNLWFVRPRIEQTNQHINYFQPRAFPRANQHNADVISFVTLSAANAARLVKFLCIICFINYKLYKIMLFVN